VNRYALLKDSINDSIFGVIVDSNGLSKFYGVSAKGLEWSKWANGINVKSENNGLPIGVVVGGYSALRNTNPNYIQALVDTVSLRNPSINKKQGISDSLIKNSSSVVPGVRDAELRAFDIDKRNEAIAFKARAFRTDSKVSSLLTQVRAERLGFVSAEGVFSSRNPIHTPEVKQAEIIDSYGRSLQRAIGLSLIRKKSAKMLAVVRKDQALAQSFGIEFKAAGIGPKIGSRLGGGLRSAPAGMSFVDVTGVTDADTDGIVFEGKPGLERPIIPRFMVPKDLARKLSGIVDGDAEEIEKQRRAGNTSVQFDEGKLRNIVASVGGDASLLQAVTNDRGVPATTTSGRERVSAAARNVAGNIASRRREIASRRGMRSGQRADLGDATPLSPGELNKLSEQEIVDRLIEDRYAGLNLDEAAKKYGLKGGRVEARRLEAREMQRRNNQGMRSRTTPPGIVREDYFNFEEYDFNDQVVDAMGNWMGRPDQQEMRERSGGLEALWEDFKKSDEYRDMEADMLDDNLKFSGATSDNPVLVSTAGNDRGQAEIKYDGEMFTVDVSLWNNEQDELFDTPEAKKEFDNLSEAEEYASSLFSDGMRSRNLKMSGAPKEIQDSYSEDDIKKIENSLRTGGRQELRLSWDSENNGWMLDSFDADGEVFIEADAPLVRLTDAISDVIADRYDSEAYGGEPPYLSNMNELLPDEEDRDDSWIKEYPVSGMRSVTGISEMNTSGAPKEYADALEKWRGYFGETPTRRNRRTGKVTESERNHPALPSVYWNKENESWVLSFDGEPTELSIYSDDPREAAKAVSDILETTADRYRWENEDNFGDISDLADIGEMYSDGDGKDRTVKITAGMRSSSGNINSFDDYLNHPAFDRDFAEWRKDNPGKNKRDFIDDPDGAEEYFSLGMEEAGASLNPESYFGTSGMRSRSGGMRSRVGGGKWDGKRPEPQDIKAGADLSGADLSYQILRRIDLSDANLTGANLVGTKINGANLKGANLTDANLSRTELQASNLVGAKLTGTDFTSANLSNVNLTNADLSSANLYSTMLDGANLTNANLQGANLRGAKMQATNLNNANLIKANLTDANLTDAKLIAADLIYADLRKAKMIRADLRFANLAGANLTRANLGTANLKKANLEEANLTDANVTDANLTDAKLDNAVLTNVRMPRDWIISNLGTAGMRSRGYRNDDDSDYDNEDYGVDRGDWDDDLDPDERRRIMDGMRRRSGGMRSRYSDDSADGYAEADAPDLDREDYENYIDTPTFEEHLGEWLVDNPGKTREDFINDPDGAELAWDKFFENDDPKKYYGISDAEWAAAFRSRSGNINSFDDYLNHPAFDRDFAEWRKDNPGKNKRDFIDDPDGAEEYFSLGMEEAGASLNPESYFGTSGMRSRSGGMRSSTKPLVEAELLTGDDLTREQEEMLFEIVFNNGGISDARLNDGDYETGDLMEAAGINLYNIQVNDELAQRIEDAIVERDKNYNRYMGKSYNRDYARTIIERWQDSVNDDPDEMFDALSLYEGDLVAAMENHYDEYVYSQLDTFENSRDGGMRSRSGGMRSSTQLRGRDFKRDANIRANHLGKDAETWPRTARLQDVIYPERPYYGAQDVSRSDKIILSAPSENGGPEGKVYIAEFDDETGTLTVSWGRADSRNLQTKVYSGKTEEDFHKLLRDKEKRGYRLEGGHIPAKSSSYDKDVDWKADHEKQAKMGMRSSTGTEQRPYTNVPVTGSSALRQASYNAEKQELVVTYANGKTYTYKNFSNDDLDNSLSGPDYVLTGTAVNQIKKNHDFREGGTHTFDPQYQDVQGPGGEFSVEKLSRLGRGEKTQIPVSGSSAIEALTWDDENEDLIVTYAGGRTYTYKDVDSYWIEDLERETGTGRIINNIKKEGYRVVDGGEHGDMPSEGLTAERAEFGMRSRMAPSSGRIRAAEMEISARPQGMASRRSEGLKDPRFAVPGRDRVDPSDGQLWNRLSDEEKTTVANRAVNRERMLLNEFKQRFPRWWDRASKEADKKGWDKDLMKGGNAGWLDELHRFVTNLADDPNYPEKSRADAEKQFNDLQALYNMRINRGSHDLLEHLNPTSRRYLFDDARRDDSKKTGISASSKEMKTPSTAPRPFGDPIDVGTPIREQVGQNQKKPMKERLDAYYKRMSDKILYSDPARQARREMRKARRQGINAGGFTEREANPVDDAKRKIRRRKRLKQMRKNRTRDVSTISDSSTSNRIDGRLAHTDGQGSLVFGDKLASTLSTMMQNYRTEAKLKQTKGGVNKNRALAVLWDGAGYNGTPNIVTPDEFKALHAAGWVPVVRGHGNGSNGVRYANDWIDDPVRFITGQGGEAQGEGEYWARATQGGGGWFSWMDGSLPAGTVGLLPPSTRRVNKAELRKIQAEHAPLAKAIKAFDAGLPTGEREKMNAEEYVDQLRDHLRGSLGPIYESTMSTKMGQMTSKILESLSGSSDSKKQELLDSLEFLELISKKRTSNSYAPLLGYDTIMADSGVELIHNRTAITIVGDTFKRDDAVNLAKSKA
jgi:uncharacterized protein YjbI with pentapeptide repeats/predicted DNA-binding WGR domain protein